MSPREVRKPHWEQAQEPRIPWETLLTAVGVALAALVMGFVMGWMIAAVAG